MVTKKEVLIAEAKTLYSAMIVDERDSTGNSFIELFKDQLLELIIPRIDFAFSRSTVLTNGTPKIMGVSAFFDDRVLGEVKFEIDELKDEQLLKLIELLRTELFDHIQAPLIINDSDSEE